MTRPTTAARSRLAALAVTASAAVLLLSVTPAVAQGSAGSSSGPVAVDASFEDLCTPTDPGLAEVSGLVSDGATMYAIGDSGTDDTVWVLGEDCAVTGTLPVSGTPVDVEDLASAGGRLWLADTGDNNRARAAVALTSIDPGTGAGSGVTLSYPDGAHDAEAILIGRDGRLVVVTKEILLDSGIYTTDTPVADLPAGPTLLRRVGQVRLGPTDTPGGPVPVAGSTLVTGGAVSADGRVVALRTYTDLYLYPAPDGDVVAALTTAVPIRVPMPGQPQGEAIAFTPSGDLLSASEAAGGPLPPVRVLRDATALVPEPEPEPEPEPRVASVGVDGATATVVGVALGAIALTGALVHRARRRT